MTRPIPEASFCVVGKFDRNLFAVYRICFDYVSVISICSHKMMIWRECKTERLIKRFPSVTIKPTEWNAG